MIPAAKPIIGDGHPADMTALGAVAERHDIAVFEDAAQVHAAQWQQQFAGTFGAFGMFSSYPTKNMSSGEGGMVSCGSAGVARQVALLRNQLLRNQGMQRQYENEVVGLNNRMTDLRAAIGRVQLRKLAGWTAQRQANAAFFDAHLQGVTPPAVAEPAGAGHHRHRSQYARQGRLLMTRTLRAGLVGIGMMGRHHARELGSLDGVELVAVADPAGDPHGVLGGREVLRDVESLIATGLDLCVVAVPTAQHEAVGLALAAIATTWDDVSHFRGVSEGDVVRYAIAKSEPLRTEHEAFRDAVLGRTVDVVTMRQGLATVAVAEAVLESAKTGATVALPSQK